MRNLCPRVAPMVAAAALLLTASASAIVHAAPNAPFQLTKLYPTTARVGERFNYQPTKQENALSARYTGQAPIGTSLVFNGHILSSVQANNVISALIPSSYLSKPGSYSVYLEYHNLRSNTLTFKLIPGIRLQTLYPAAVRVGEKFNYQSKYKENALSVSFKNAPIGTHIVFGGHVLSSTWNKSVISALVPAKYLDKAGKIPVYLQYQGARSNTKYFVVKPGLRLLSLFPPSIHAGRHFNFQAKYKESALSVKSLNAPAGTRLVFAGHALATSKTGRILSALIPSRLISKPGNYPVYLKIDDAVSNTLTFQVLP